MFSALAVLLSFGSPTVPVVPPNPTLIAYEKNQLQERNRMSSQFIREEVVVPEGLFAEYENINVPAAMLNRAFDPANHVKEGFHFDPKHLSRLDFEITNKPFLTQRGIKEIIGVGVSDFTGSKPNRIQNILRGLEEYDGKIISQGEKFSFNENLGEIDEENGYAWARTILAGQDRWGLGGGICQVSTNLFRAALNAGLPIADRRAHSYYYSKYSPAGLDATIYKGIQDLKFTNDTPGDILIKVVVRDQQLAVFFFGTRDRAVALERVSEWKGYDGRLATHWMRTVKNGQIVFNENFSSSYTGSY